MYKDRKLNERARVVRVCTREKYIDRYIEIYNIHIYLSISLCICWYIREYNIRMYLWRAGEIVPLVWGFQSSVPWLGDLLLRRKSKEEDFLFHSAGDRRNERGPKRKSKWNRRALEDQFSALQMTYGRARESSACLDEERELRNRKKKEKTVFFHCIHTHTYMSL